MRDGDGKSYNIHMVCVYDGLWKADKKQEANGGK